MSILAGAVEGADKRAALIPFITAGFPRADDTGAIMRALAKAGADVIEVGVPFSDPMADGSAIQQANMTALANGMTLKKTLAQVSEATGGGGADCPPVVLMGYANSFVNYGIAGFAADAAAAGVRGVIVVDLDDAARAEWREVLSAAGVDLVNLIAPTTAEARMRALAASSQGFVYYVTLRGITGADSLQPAAVAENICRIRQYAAVPVAAGFGVQTPAHAAALADDAQGVVVGSALVRVLAAAESSADLEQAVDDFIRPIGAALR